MMKRHLKLTNPGVSRPAPPPAASNSQVTDKKADGKKPRTLTEQSLGQVSLDFLARRAVLLLLLVVIAAATTRILKPYLNVLIMASLLASIAGPLQTKLTKMMKGRRSIAAFISTLLIFLVVVIPITLLTIGLVNQTADFVKSLVSWIQAGKPQQLLESPLIQRVIHRLQPLTGEDFSKIDIWGAVMNAASSIGQRALQQGTAIVSNLTFFAMDVFLLLLALFYMLRDGDRLLAWAMHLSPLSASHEEQMLIRIRTISRSALLGTVSTSLAQGLVGGIGLYITGLPGLFWGAMIAFASMIPVIGSALIWAPASLYLLITGHAGKALFLLIWSVVCVGSIDNFLRPLIMKGEAGMSPVLLFLAILGGIQTFGLLGIIYGPLIFGLLAIILYLYELEFSDYLRKQDQN